MLPYNIPAFAGTEVQHVQAAISYQHLSGNGPYTRRVHRVFEQELGFPKVFLTHSCTAALEMAAILLQLQPGDEVILPSFTHVGTANAFIRAGATLRFADSLPHHPNIDPAAVASLITPRTRAIVIVHYAGLLCDMDTLARLAADHNLILIEDAAHAITATYKHKQAGTFGHIAAFSFHETKNLHCGQGGLLVLNDPTYIDRAAILWENGTNRAAFFAGLVDQYTWVDTGSCFLPSELSAAYLYGQLEARDHLLSHRLALWQTYYDTLAPYAQPHTFQLPHLDPDRQHNAHIFYLLLPDRHRRDTLMHQLRGQGFLAVFHYIPLHSSPYFLPQHNGPDLPHAQSHSERILRLPLFHTLQAQDQYALIQAIIAHFN